MSLRAHWLSVEGAVCAKPKPAPYGTDGVLESEVQHLLFHVVQTRTPTYFVKSYYSNKDANERGAGGEWHQLSGLSERLSWGGVAEPSSLISGRVCWGTCIGWRIAKSEGDISSLMSPLLRVLIHGI